MSLLCKMLWYVFVAVLSWLCIVPWIYNLGADVAYNQHWTFSIQINNATIQHVNRTTLKVVNFTLNHTLGATGYAINRTFEASLFTLDLLWNGSESLGMHLWYTCSNVSHVFQQDAHQRYTKFFNDTYHWNLSKKIEWYQTAHYTLLISLSKTLVQVIMLDPALWGTLGIIVAPVVFHWLSVRVEKHRDARRIVQYNVFQLIGKVLVVICEAQENPVYLESLFKLLVQPIETVTHHAKLTLLQAVNDLLICVCTVFCFAYHDTERNPHGRLIKSILDLAVKHWPSMKRLKVVLVAMLVCSVSPYGPIVVVLYRVTIIVLCYYQQTHPSLVSAALRGSPKSPP